ncbi:hypothetical protein Sya03_59440 [Spirilliplanes yamanashiensis]|uniref:Uncharacterized protein n=1 Tax=Spirilliplanes yamanashiensis TaxID=42233 RepID=A0A8J3YF32_9ACTN|nr:hypothetical protein Sya03_59440 [Spirilliplanes yamanashiensis]
MRGDDRRARGRRQVDAVVVSAPARPYLRRHGVVGQGHPPLADSRRGRGGGGPRPGLSAGRAGGVTIVEGRRWRRLRWDGESIAVPGGRDAGDAYEPERRDDQHAHADRLDVTAEAAAPPVASSAHHNIDMWTWSL